MEDKQANFQLHEDTLVLNGRWVSDNLVQLQKAVDQLKADDISHITAIDGTQLEHMDTGGAWMIIHLFKKMNIAPVPSITNVSAQMATLWQQLTQLDDQPNQEVAPQPNIIAEFFIFIGQGVSSVTHELFLIIAFIGRLFTTFGRLLLNPGRFRLAETSAQVYKAGFKAVGIVTLIAFSIAVVIGFLMIAPLKAYGAEYLTMSLVAVGVLQEMGVLLTAIMVAGRTGSAFAAELGVMNVNEETAALETLGMDVFEVLVVPRIIGVIISICLLTIIADLAGLAADLIVSITMLGASPASFFNELFSLNLGYDFILGFVRAPVYGLVIGAIGCLRGLQVRSSAQEVGTNTTAAVVQSIFLVIFLHAFFALFFQVTGIR
ncbi:MAG: MlaE family ABC transporter permease [Alphaproteobacteria bacterium]